MTAPEPRSGGLDANARGILILVVAVVIGALLLWKVDDGGRSTATKVEAGTNPSSAPNTTADLSSDTTSTSTISPITSSSTSAGTQGHQPGQVSVVVLNGGGPVGAAAATTSQIKSKGYMAGPAGNANLKVDTTVIYYADGYIQDATAVAALLGKASGAAQPKPASALGKGAETANVVVVLGKDAPPVSGGSSTTVAGGTSTTTSGATSTTASGSTTSGTG